MRLVGVLLLIAPAVAGCGDDPEVGQAWKATREFEGNVAQVRVPSGTVILTLGQPTQTMEGSDAETRESLHADADDAFVGVRVEFDDSGLSPFEARHGADRAIGPRVRLVAGDESVDLDVPTRGFGEYHLIPEGQLAVEVTYDGVTQRVDPTTGEVERGKAAGVYRTDLAYQEPTSCSTRRWTERVRADMSCLVEWGELAYAVGAGWSDADHPWRVVDISSTVSEIKFEGMAFQVTQTSDESTLAGASPVSQREQDGSSPERFRSADVFAQGNNGLRLKVVRKVSARAADGGDRTFTFTAKVPLR